MEIFSLKGVVDLAMGESLKQLGQLEEKADKAHGVLTKVQKTGSAAGPALSLSFGNFNKVMGTVLSTIGKFEIAFAGLQKIFKPFIMGAELAADFEKQMRNVNSVAHLSEGAFDAMSDRVRDLGAQLKVSVAPAESAAAMYDIMSSGITDTAKAIDVLSASLIAGSAGLTNAATAARAITGVMNAYGQETMSAQKVSDIMFQTVNLGVVTFEQLAQHIGGVTSIAATAGVSFEELSAVIAQLTVKGIRAPIAIESLRAAISQLEAPSEEARKEMKEFGIQIDANSLRQKGLINTLVELADKTGGNAQALKTILQDINAVNVAMALTSDHGKAATDAMQQMGNAGGSSMAALREQNKSLAKQWGDFVASLKTLGTAFSTGVLPYLKDFVEYLQSSVDFFMHLNDQIERLKTEGGPMGTLARGFAGIGDAIEGLKQAMVGWGILSDGVTKKQIADEQELSKWLQHNRDLMDRGRVTNPAGDTWMSPGAMAQASSTTELAQGITGARAEQNRLRDENRASAERRAGLQDSISNIGRYASGPAVEVEKDRLRLLDEQAAKEEAIRNKRIEQLGEQIKIEQEALKLTRERDAAAARSEAQITAMNKKYSDSVKTMTKEEADAIERGKTKWKEWGELKEKQGFKTKRDELASIDAVMQKQASAAALAKQHADAMANAGKRITYAGDTKAETAYKFGATTMQQVKETRAKLVREIAEDDVKTNEAAQQQMATAADRHAQHLVTLAQHVLAERQRAGQATVADQAAVSAAVINEASKERAAKLLQLQNQEADLKREGKWTVQAGQAFAAQRGEAEEAYTAKVLAESERRKQIAKAEQIAVLQAKKTEIDQRIAAMDIEKNRLDFLAAHGRNVEATYRQMVQQRMQLEIDSLHAAENAELAGAQTVEQVARIKAKYAGETANLQKKYASEEAQRQYEWLERERQMHESLQDEIYKMTHSAEEAEVLDMRRRVEELRRQGYDEIEIAQWVAAKKQDLLSKEKDSIGGVTSALKEASNASKGGVQSLEEMVAGINAQFGGFHLEQPGAGGSSKSALLDAMNKAGFGGVGPPVVRPGPPGETWIPQPGSAGQGLPLPPFVNSSGRGDLGLTGASGGYGPGIAGQGGQGAVPAAIAGDYGATLRWQQQQKAAADAWKGSGFGRGGTAMAASLPGQAAVELAGASASAGTTPGGGVTGAVGSSSSTGIGLTTSKIELHIDVNGKVQVVTGSLSEGTAEGFVRDLGIASRILGQSTRGLGKI